jgi:excisionase family DNA binding protein
MQLTEIRYLTIDEVAQLLRIHPDTVRRLLREKRLPGKKIGREWRISQEALDNFVREEKR